MNSTQIELSVQNAMELARRKLRAQNLGEAVEILRQVDAVIPNNVDVLTLLAAASRRSHRLVDASFALSRAIALSPTTPRLFRLLADCQRATGHLDRSIDLFRRAVQIDPLNGDNRAGLAYALLQAGDWSAGFAAYEYRPTRRKFLSRLARTKFELWEPGKGIGRSLVLVGEQGAGDVVQFIRYASAIAALGVKVHVLCADHLVRLIATVPGVAGASSSPPRDMEFIEQVLSLPYRFGATPDNVPADIPYLSAAATPESRLAESAGLKIGLVWAGNARHQNDELRSCPFSAMARLFSEDRARFFSLQFGRQRRETAPFAERLVDAVAKVRDMADTAAIINQLDLVISVDTAVAHVAAAMGRPVWLLLSASADWRWMNNRESSPWYPTMRLFRQSRLGDWDGLIGRVSTALADFVTTEGHRLADPARHGA